MNKEEKEFQKRILFENDSFLVYLPFFTDYPYGAFIVSKSHKGNLSEFDEKEKWDLAEALKLLTGGFDALFDKPFPYMMNIHQTPVNSEEYADSNKYYHFHIEFYPPLRDKDKIKWYASSEMGAWAAANTMAVEETAITLRNAIEKFKKIQ
jgi:UDPglucose--hexose-1-phosphate uridylyltransferase